MGDKVTLTNRVSGSNERQVRTIIGLGLRKFGHSRILKDTPEVRGMIFKVQHLVKAETVKEEPKKIAQVVPADKEEREQLRKELKEQKKAVRDVEEEMMELEKEKQKVLGWFEKHAGEFSREKNEHLLAVTELLEKKEKLWIEIQERMGEIEQRI